MDIVGIRLAILQFYMPLFVRLGAVVTVSRQTREAGGNIIGTWLTVWSRSTFCLR
jgi:hypothetical protein